MLSIWYITDFSDDEGEETEKDNEDPEEWGKFLHLKERVGLIFCLDWKVYKNNVSAVTRHEGQVMYIRSDPNHGFMLLSCQRCKFT